MTVDRDAAAVDPQPGQAMPSDRAVSQRAARLMLVVALLLLGVWILWDFLPALGWAVVFATASWPLYRRFVTALPVRWHALAAPLLFTLLIGLVFVVPLALAAVEVGREARVLVHWLGSVQRTGLVVPDWLASVPLVGESADAWWRVNLSSPGAASEIFGGPGVRVLAGWAREFGVELAHRLAVFVFTLLTLFFLFREGATLGRRLRILDEYVLGSSGERLASQMIAAVRGAVNGLVLVGLGEGAVLAIAYAVTGVAHPALAGTLTGLLAMIPFGAPVAFSIASLTLLADGRTAAAVGLFAFSAVVIFMADHFLRPALIGGAAKLPFLWVLLGLLGGLETFGLLGLFLGPAIMAALVSLWQEWTQAPTAASRV